MKKKIIADMKDNSSGCGEIFSFTAVARQSDLTLRFPIEEKWGKQHEIFEGLAKIEFLPRDKLIYFEESWAQFGNKKPKFHKDMHYIQNNLELYGLDQSDYLPSIILTETELKTAEDKLKNIKNPVCFMPMAGNWRKNDLTAIYRMLDRETWDIIINELKNEFTFLYISKLDNFINYRQENVIPFFGASLREVCSILAVVKRSLGIENGLAHASIASGATHLSFNQSYDKNKYYHFDNFSYESSAFKDGKVRAKYFSHENIGSTKKLNSLIDLIYEEFKYEDILPLGLN